MVLLQANRNSADGQEGWYGYGGPKLLFLCCAMTLIVHSMFSVARDLTAILSSHWCKEL